MPRSAAPIITRKYADRPLRDAGASRYVTLNGIAGIERDDGIAISHAGTSEDITWPIPALLTSSTTEH